MFQDDINRKINGVVKVSQDDSSVLVQELNEYVVTRELKKHFITFLNNYNEAFSSATGEIGVWISGFFGSGKSHFLKMLSYLLENKEVQGVRTVERFRSKFADDPATFMLIDRATRGQTDTILFNIDVEGFSNKNKTAVLRVFAKMFYNYLGFYGEDLKVARLEQFITKNGKMDAFHRVFEEKIGSSWLQSRESYVFLGDYIVSTLMEVLGMSEKAASNWLNSPDDVEISIRQLVSEIKEYVDQKPSSFRLLFMVDEVGQYVGGDTDLLLNLQSLVEEIGSKCGGKVWVVCTGQEAIDEIIKARENEFSRIQGRFTTRLSLSSASADEVIQKRILRKTAKAKAALENVYNINDSVLRNLFSFRDSRLDMKGYGGPDDFARNFPFVPYQFILMQKVFTEIRKHGNAGKHLSGGERSMLSGFQEAAQKIQNKDEFALSPFYLFYDTVHTFLDSSIRRVIERCMRAAEARDGLEPQDVNVLKLLYLIRYVDDVKANLDNIVILMADDIRLDKVSRRGEVRESLDRLLSQNYIGRSGDTYNFLTDEEQDVAREIKNTSVDTSEITKRIGQMVFGDIYTAKKFHYGRYDFSFDQMVDTLAIGNPSGGLRLRILTVATDPVEKNSLSLLTKSSGQALVVLSENPYYELLENAMKIRKYVLKRNVSGLPLSVQAIIRRHNDEAAKYETTAKEELKAAVTNAQFYVAGQHLDLKGGDAKGKIDQALEYLVTQTYSELDKITEFAETDDDILAILRSSVLPGMEVANSEAVKIVEKYLEMQSNMHLPTSMADLQSRYQKIPYGWREIDIAAVVARLINQQKVTIKRSGTTIQPNDPKLPDMLRKKSEIGKTSVAKRQNISGQKLRATRDFLRDYFEKMDVPEDEDGIVSYIVEKFEKEKDRYHGLIDKYIGHKYPDQGKIQKALALVNAILSQKKDNVALIDKVIECKDDLYAARDALQDIKEFFRTRVKLFDAAVKFEESLRYDQDYFAEENIEAKQALEQIKQITTVTAGVDFNYTRIPQLNELMKKVRDAHDIMVEEKRKRILNTISSYRQEIHARAGQNPEAIKITKEADTFYANREKRIASTELLALLDGLIQGIWEKKKKALAEIEIALLPKSVTPTPDPAKKVYNKIHRLAVFPPTTLTTEAEIDAYVEKIRSDIKKYLTGFDGIKLN